MTLLLTKKTDDLPANFRYNRPENVPEVWKSTFMTPTGFMVATSERRTGKNKHSGKSYSSFQETKVEFFSMKSGVLNVYMKERNAVHTPDGKRNRSRMGSVRNSLNGFLRRYGYHGTNREFYEAGAQSLGYESMDALVNKEFPLRKDFRATIPGIGSLLRQENLTSMSRSLLGKDFQKGIPRAFAQPEGFRADEMRSQLLELTMIFQGIVPTDWIVDILEARDANRINRILHNREELRVIRRILRTASETQLRRLTRNPTSEFSGLFMDSIDQIDTFEGVEFRNLDELHDTVAPRMFRQKKLKPQDIELSKKATKFVGEDDGFSVIAPGNTQDLYSWSSTMGNCISGYGAKAVQGHSQLFAVMQGDKMIANIELDAQGSIRQLLGQHNRSLEPELSSAVKDRVLSVWPKATVNTGWQ